MTKAIETAALTRRFGDCLAVDALELEIEHGELFTLLGVNGAGKTTTIRMLSCLLRPSSGDARMYGSSVVTETAEAKKKINISPQETAIAGNLSVRENLELVAGLYGCGRREAASRAEEMLKTFGIVDKAVTKASKLSGGQQRRLSIAMALITRPEILFLDEPTLGLDVLARRELWRTVEKLKGHVTIILTTHYMEEAEALSDRVGVMVSGRLLSVGTPAELIERTGAKSFEEAFISIVEGEKNKE